MNKKLPTVTGFWQIVILVIAFIAVAIVFFFAWQYITETKSRDNGSSGSEKSAEAQDGLSLSPVETLDYSADVKRFLTVYFNQEFTNEADKLNFVKLELERFANYNTTVEADRVVNESFVAALRQLYAKKQVPGSDVSVEEAALFKIMNSLN